MVSTGRPSVGYHVLKHPRGGYDLVSTRDPDLLKKMKDHGHSLHKTIFQSDLKEASNETPDIQRLAIEQIRVKVRANPDAESGTDAKETTSEERRKKGPDSSDNQGEGDEDSAITEETYKIRSTIQHEKHGDWVHDHHVVNAKSSKTALNRIMKKIQAAHPNAHEHEVEIVNESSFDLKTTNPNGKVLLEKKPKAKLDHSLEMRRPKAEKLAAIIKKAAKKKVNEGYDHSGKFSPDETAERWAHVKKPYMQYHINKSKAGKFKIIQYYSHDGSDLPKNYKPSGPGRVHHRVGAGFDSLEDARKALTNPNQSGSKYLQKINEDFPPKQQPPNDPGLDARYGKPPVDPEVQKAQDQKAKDQKAYTDDKEKEPPAGKTLTGEPRDKVDVAPNMSMGLGTAGVRSGGMS